MKKLDGQKLAILNKILKNNKLDGIVISDFADMQYLVGEIFVIGEAIVLFHKKGVYITSRSLYVPVVRAKYPEIEIDACDENRHLQIIKKAKELKLKKIGFDLGKESYLAGKTYKENGFVETPSLIAQARVSKTKEELERMAAAAQAAYGAMEHIKSVLEVGMTELEAAMELEKFMKQQGAKSFPFNAIVAFGPNSASPHHVTGSDKLKKNMVVLMDYGCVINGYSSDITRTFWFGDKEPAEFTKIFNIVKGAHDEVVKKAKYAMTGAQIDNIARKYISKYGYGQYFTHGTGHGVGMENHEEAYINQQNRTKKILDNYCFSVEPGIYLEGRFGVRYEDCFYMTKKGIKIIK